MIVYTSIFILLTVFVANCISNPAKSCSIPVKCRRTCADPNPPNCPDKEPLNINQDGCQCKPGYILSKIGGKCIKIEDCPKGCKGDLHAIAKECPIPCPATCNLPEPMLTCRRKCDKFGCECEAGYLLSDGKCILPDDCKSGNPCGVNATFASCKSHCQYDYCPENDSREPLVCENPSNQCYPGCICKLNHKRKSRGDNTCIVSSECPPVKCTRQNEVWSPCPSACLAETCDDIDKKITVCNTLVLNCEPKCICKPNTFRNASDICIPAEECRKSKGNEPTCGHNEEYVMCRTICPPQSCEISYTEYNCGDSPKCEPGCDCIKDHLRNSSGVCILNDNCPPPISCGLNEIPVPCKRLCPPQTCISLTALYECPEEIPCEAGCDCEMGYLRNDNGECIPSSECSKGVDLCGINATYSDCGFRCPNQYCPENDDLTEIACKPGRPCPPGCLCKDNYRRKSYEEDVCILASDCPSVNCTRPNEVWNSCTQCLAERCEDMNRPVLCSDPPGTNCKPRCVCAPDYYRDSTNICIRKEECVTQCTGPK